MRPSTSSCSDVLAENLVSCTLMSCSSWTSIDTICSSLRLLLPGGPSSSVPTQSGGATLGALLPPSPSTSDVSQAHFLAWGSACSANISVPLQLSPQDQVLTRVVCFIQGPSNSDIMLRGTPTYQYGHQRGLKCWKLYTSQIFKD